jgi:hypothetical protein
MLAEPDRQSVLVSCPASKRYKVVAEVVVVEIGADAGESWIWLLLVAVVEVSLECVVDLSRWTLEPKYFRVPQN